jgi:hypothetical protein
VAVAFGLAAKRERLYGRLAALDAALGQGLPRLGIERILDIGPEIAAPSDLAGLPVERRGPLAAAEICAILADARVGLIDYPMHVLTKSTILAAYLAHGMLAVNASTAGAPTCDLREGRHFVHPDRLAAAALDAESIASAGYAWYRTHDRQSTAELVHELIV